MRLIRTTLLLISLTAPDAFADDVFKWEDKQGVIHYSNKAPQADAKPAELPDITRADFQLPAAVPLSCEQHGGTNCQAGADQDGSVICADGFKDSSARFRVSCSSPRLQIDDISEFTDDGSFSVFVRNTKSVAAVAPSASYKDEGKEIVLEGPKEIEPFGVGEFVFKLEKGRKIPRRPGKGEVKLSCGNC